MEDGLLKLYVGGTSFDLIPIITVNEESEIDCFMDSFTLGFDTPDGYIPILDYLYSNE